jgi:hypothetical protein
MIRSFPDALALDLGIGVDRLNVLGRPAIASIRHGIGLPVA